MLVHPSRRVCGLRRHEPVCPVEAIFYEDDVPDQWTSFTQINADFFEELGSPGGASKVGQTDNDPQAVKDLPHAGRGSDPDAPRRAFDSCPIFPGTPWRRPPRTGSAHPGRHRRSVRRHPP